MGSVGNLVTDHAVERGTTWHARCRGTDRRTPGCWLLVVLSAVVGAVVGALGTWGALRYAQPELGDLMRLPAEQVFDRPGRERLGVGRGGLLVLVAVTPSLLIGGLVVLAARLSGWWMLLPPTLAVILGSAASAVALAAEAGPTWQLVAGAATAGLGACLGVALSDRRLRLDS